jgi:phage tail tape-measure protein
VPLSLVHQDAMQTKLLNTLFGQFDRVSRELAKLRDQQKAEVSELKIQLNTAELEIELLRSQLSQNQAHDQGVEEAGIDADADERKRLKKRINGNFFNIVLTFLLTKFHRFLNSKS